MTDDEESDRLLSTQEEKVKSKSRKRGPYRKARMIQQKKN